MLQSAAFMTLVVIICVSLDHVDGQARVCYFGPPPDPGPDTPDSQHWMKQILQEIRQRCPGRAIMPRVTQEQGDITTVSTNECWNPEPLGVEEGSIPDERFRASSLHLNHYASRARLNQASFWLPAIYTNSWIEVDLVNSTFVSGVITQGSAKDDSRVQKYTVMYQTLPSSSSVNDYVTDGKGNTQVFNGNTDNATAPVTNFFHDTIKATVVRLVPFEWHKKPALRFELLGCELN